MVVKEAREIGWWWRGGEAPEVGVVVGEGCAEVEEEIACYFKGSHVDEEGQGVVVSAHASTGGGFVYRRFWGWVELALDVWRSGRKACNAEVPAHASEIGPQIADPFETSVR